MKIETFELERTQSLYENTVEYNLTESGIHPFTLHELLSPDEIEAILSTRIGYGQTNGSIQLRDTISRLYPGADRNNVLVTAGSAEANLLSVWTLLEPEDELVLMLPNYMQIWGLARAFGIRVKPFYLKEELSWQPDLAELEGLITPKTRMIAICNPNNPTGAVLTPEAMDAIIEMAKNCHAWIHADEVYCGAELNGQETPSFYGRYEKVMVANSLSKAYSLPGLRIGWLVGPAEAIARCWAQHDYTSIATSILSNRIATIALQPESRKKILQRNRKILRENLALLTQWAKNFGELFTFVPPAAGGIVFLRYALKINSTALATKLRTEQSTFIVPGDCFGMDHYIRIGIGSERSYLLAGLERIATFLSQIR